MARLARNQGTVLAQKRAKAKAENKETPSASASTSTSVQSKKRKSRGDTTTDNNNKNSKKQSDNDNKSDSESEEQDEDDDDEDEEGVVKNPLAQEEYTVEKKDEEETKDIGNNFASTMQSLLMAPVPETGTGEVLSGRKKTPLVKELEEEQRRRKKAREASAARKELASVGLALPSVGTKELEKDLRKIATRGVVALFNAIRKHQYQQETADDSMISKSFSNHSGKAGEKRAADSEAFMSLLKSESKSKATDASSSTKPSASKKGAAPEASSSGWDVLRDDYMLGAKLRDFGDEDEDDV